MKVVRRPTAPNTIGIPETTMGKVYDILPCNTSSFEGLTAVMRIWTNSSDEYKFVCLEGGDTYSFYASNNLSGYRLVELNCYLVIE